MSWSFNDIAKEPNFVLEDLFDPTDRQHEWEYYKKITLIGATEQGLWETMGEEHGPTMKALLKRERAERPKWRFRYPSPDTVVQKNASAFKLITSRLSPRLILEYAYYDSASDLWTALKDRFKSSDLIQRNVTVTVNNGSDHESENELSVVESIENGVPGQDVDCIKECSGDSINGEGVTSDENDENEMEEE